MSSTTVERSRLARPTQSSRRFPGRVATTIVLVCLVVMLLVRIFRDELSAVMKMFDTAAANLATLVLSFLIAVTLAVWFICFSDYRTTTKARVLLLLLALGIVVASGFQIEGPSGDMAFSLVPRPWLGRMLPTDRPPPPGAAEGRADLSTTTADDYPRFLGPLGTNYLAAAGDKPLARDWESNPPKLRWRQTSGQGWSAFAIVNGFAVTLEQHGSEEWTTCYEAASGKLVWKCVQPGRHEAPMGGVGPRSTPTIHAGHVYSIGGLGRLLCLDGNSGKVIWEKDLLAETGTDAAVEKQAVMWGRAGSPLVLADLGIIVVPGGGRDGAATSLIAYDLETGTERWRGGTSQISYVSPVEATLAGVRQIISVNEEDVTGHDCQTGEVLWKHSWPGSSSGNASCSQPHVLSGDRLLLTKGYGEGAEMIRVRKTGGKFAVETVWKNPRALKTKFTNVTIIADHAYGLSDGILECVRLEDGESRWRRGRYGHGQVLGVGDVFLVLSERGELALVEANPQEHVELDRIDALDGKTWNSIALYGRLLLIRNAQEAACIELP